MAKVMISERERWGLKWHLNGLTMPDRASGRKLDRVWERFDLDSVAAPPTAGGEFIPNDPTVEIDLTSDERDNLIEWLDRPMLGGMRRVLAAFDGRLVKSRDGD